MSYIQRLLVTYPLIAQNILRRKILKAPTLDCTIYVNSLLVLIFTHL
jgi:hypothetical protein